MTGISNKNVIGASGIGAAALLYLYEAYKLPLGRAGMPGIGFVPVIIGAVLLALCVVLIARELIFPAPRGQAQADPWEEESEGESTGLKKPILITAAMLAFPVALVNLGFLISSAALLFVVLRVMEFRGWLGSLIAALLTVALAHVIFSLWLNVYFPKGILG